MNLHLSALAAAAGLTLTTSVADESSTAGSANESETREQLLLAAKAPQRDRQAILAMAGEYEVSFDFKETVAFVPDYELKDAYHETALELVEVAADTGDRIVLQHLLIVNGGESVIKHWKQEWRFEDRDLYENVGERSWKLRRLTEDERRGTWTQKVSQVDDSPRYESYGRWVHHRNVSSWESAWTQRPLPRREYTKREDYQVMMARNRHTITPAGWVHEQDNFKQVSHDPESPVLCREAGLNRYTRTTQHDFEAARRYWSDTRDFWTAVSGQWDAHLEANGGFVLKPSVEARPAYKHLFYMAKKSGEEGGQHLQEQIAKADELIRKFVVATSES